MTLGRQLLSGTALIFAALLIGIEAIYVSSAKSSLEEQLDAHANETATSLALSIGTRAQSLDETVLNIMVNPIFDRGHFESIVVTSAAGQALFERRLGSDYSIDVPAWFVSLVPIPSPRGEALISAGWKQLGKVTVRVLPEYAYKQLYDTALATLAWLLMLFALALVAMRFYLADILRPLRRIEQAAASISARQFPQIDTVPRTRELQRVTEAINSLSAKIRDAMAEDSARAERLRREAYEDGQTGQLNRRGFDHAVQSLLDDQDGILSGTLAIFALGGLDEVNKAFGLSRGNEVLRQLAEAIATPRSGIDADTARPVAGRWQGPNLAAFLPNTPVDEALAWADGLAKRFAEELHRAGLPESVVVSVGLAGFSGRGELPELGQQAEGALAQVVTRKTGGAQAANRDAPAPKLDAREEVAEAIAAGRVELLFQKVMSVQDPSAAVQVEFMSRLADRDGKPVAAAVFVPVAAQYGLLAELDRKVVEKAIEAVPRASQLPAVVSLNVSLQSVSDAGFREALQKMLKAHPDVARRLVFEMTGASASRSRELCARFAADLRLAGSRFALDNFEMDRDALALVHELMPAYIKLAPVFTREIGTRDDARFILEAVLRMVRPLEIPIVAQGVEDASLVRTLLELGVAGFQGYAAGRPEPLVL